MHNPASRRTILAAASVAFLAPLFALVPALATSAGATASRSVASHSAPLTSAFCAEAVTAEQNEASSAATLTPTSIQAEYKKFIAIEGKVISSAPSQLRGDFQTLFSYTSTIYTELNKVGWNYRKVPPTFFTSLASKTNLAKITTASKAIETYLTKTCGLKLPKT